MTPVKIEVLKGMDSSVVEGLGDSPVNLVNVVHTRDGGYRPRLGRTAMLSGVLAFRQFSVTQYAYYQTASGSYLYNMKTGISTAYPALVASRDVVVYGDRVVVSGVTGNAVVPRFGALSLDDFVDESGPVGGSAEVIPTPAEGIYSQVVTQAATLGLGVHNIIADIRVSVELRAPSSGSFMGTAPITYTGPWVWSGGGFHFTSGGVQMVLLCFRLKVGSVAGTSMNPGEAKPNYLQNQFLIALPDQPQAADGTPIYGPYEPIFTITGIPADYEPVFYTSTTREVYTGYGLRGIPFYTSGVTVPQYGAFRMVNEKATQTVWYVVSSTSITLPNPSPPGVLDQPNPPIGTTVAFGGGIAMFAGYALDESVYNNTGQPMDYPQMYYNMTGRNQMGAPLHLMADYINRATPGGRAPSYNPVYRWQRVLASQLVGGSTYILHQYPAAGDEEPPLFATFFPVGSKAVFGSARTWVAPEYAIITDHNPATITDRHQAQIITRALRSYAASGPRTVFYSEPNSLDFNEQFIVPPFRKSRTVTALAATSAGVMVFGEADGVLISGDSLASFRATAIDIPGATSQATVTQWRGAVIYANNSGLYILSDGSGSKVVSNPVSREWGNPVGISLNDEDGTVLISFSDKPDLHYDIQRDAWSKWTESHTALPTSSDELIVAGGSPVQISKLNGSPEAAEAEWVVDGGATDIRKTWDRVSYRKVPFVNETTLSVKASNKSDWRVSSSTTDQESGVMVHRINEQSSALRVRLQFSGDTVIGGPLTLNVRGGREETSIKD